MKNISMIQFPVASVMSNSFSHYDDVDEHRPLSEDAYSFVGSGVMEAIGIISFAYMCHHSSFLVYESMENPTQSRWNKITHISLSVSFVIVIVFGIAGYISFTGFSQGDLLENYCMTDDAALVARLLFTVTIMLTYPIECFVVRDVALNAYYTDKTSFFYTNGVSDRVHAITTTAIVVTTYLLSMLTDCLGIVLELNGVLAAVPLAYIIPAVTYLKLDPGRLWTMEKIPAFLLAATGLIVAICGTFLSIMDVMNGISCSHGVEMPYCRDSNEYGFLNKTTTSSPDTASSLDFESASPSNVGYNYSGSRLF